MIEAALQTYREKIHFQPLPLFSLDNLRESFDSFPQYLRWAFLALSLHFSSHEYYEGQDKRVINFYTGASRRVVLGMAIEGTGEPEVLLTLCTLALCDTLGLFHPRCWGLGS